MSRPLGPLHPYVEAMLAKARYDYSLPRDLESKVWDAGPEKFAKPGHERCKEMAGTQSRGIVYQNTGTRHTPTGPMDENEPTLCTCVRKWVKENGLRPRTVKKSRGDTSPPCTVPNCPQCALRARGGGGLCGTCEHPKWTHNDQTDQKTSWAPSRGWCGHGYQGCAWDKDDQEPRHQFKPMEVEDKLPGDIRDLKIEKARGEGDDAVLARHCAPSTPKEFAATTGHAGFVSRSGRIHEFDPYQTHDEALAPDSTPPHALRIGHYGGKQPEFFAEVHHTATPEQHRTVREIARRTSREGTSFNWECHCGQQGSGVDAYEKHHGLTKSRDPMTDTVTPIMKAMATPTVVVVRHPETKLNREGKTRGWLDPGLDAEGRKDGEKVTKEIVGKFSIGRVISSDMKRTETLAKMIGKAAGVKVETERALRPWNLGEMTGKPSKSVFPQMLDYVDNKPNKPTQNGESWYAFLRRSLGFMEGVLKESRDESKVTVIVTHIRNIRSLLGWIEDDSEKGIDKFVHEEKDPVEPADFVVLRYEGKKWVADKKVEGAGRLAKASVLHPALTGSHQYHDESYPNGTVENVPTHVAIQYRDKAIHPSGEHEPGACNGGKYGTREHWEHFKNDVKTNGIREPISVDYCPDHKRAVVSEGNHRLTAAHETGVSHVPMQVFRGHNFVCRNRSKWQTKETSYESPRVRPNPRDQAYARGNMAPSDIGIPVEHKKSLVKAGAGISRVAEEERDRLLRQMDSPEHKKRCPMCRGRRGSALPWDINNGHCDDFADAVEKRVPRAASMTSEECAEHGPEGHFGSGHRWVVHEGKHYDAEATHGVDDMHKLPIFNPKGNPRPLSKSLVKAGPPSRKNQDSGSKQSNSKESGETAQPQASLQDIKPGPSKIDHTTVPHGKKVWVAIKSGPLAGRPVVLRRKESGHFTLAQSKTAPTAAGRRPIAEPSAAHKTLYPEVTGDDAETQASIGVSHQGVQGTAPGQTIDESLPNARKDMNDAGVEPWHRTPSIGEGYYAEPGFPLAPENDIDLHMSGSRRSVRWVTAKMASEGKQHQAFIFHQAKAGKTSGTRISIEQTRGKVFEKALAEVAKQSPGQGWHVRYDNEGKPKEITLVGLGKEKKEHRAFVKRFRAVLQMRGIKVGKNYHDQMDVESLCDDKPDASGRCATHGGQTYDAVLKRGHGFKGWYDGPTLSGGRGQRGAQTRGGDSAGAETAVHAGGTGRGGAEHSGRAGQQRVGGIEPGSHSTEPPVDPFGDEVRASDKEDTATLVKQAVRRARRNKNLAKYDYTTEDRAAIRAMKADPEHVKELTRVYKSLSADERAAGHGWYHVTRAKIKHMARTHGVDYKVAAAVVAAMSPRTGWANNLRSASRLLEQHVKGAGMPTRPEDIGYGGYTNNMIKGWRILKGESPQVVLDETAERTSGDKVRNFYRNFMNDQHAVTVDTWAQKGADKDREYRPIGKTTQYQPYVNAYKKAALRLGITPEALQAAVWLKVRTDEEKKPGAKNPWSKQEEGGYVPEGAYLKSQVAFDPGVIMRKSVVSDQENDLGNEREQLRQRLLRLPPTGVAHDAVTRLIEDLDAVRVA